MIWLRMEMILLSVTTIEESIINRIIQKVTPLWYIISNHVDNVCKHSYTITDSSGLYSGVTLQ